MAMTPEARERKNARQRERRAIARGMIPNPSIGGQPHQPTKSKRSTVAQFTSFGFSQEKIAALMGFSGDTLTKYYRHELDHGAEMCNAEVAARAYKKAKSTDPRNNAVLIHWLKTRMGWVEDTNHETLDTVKAVREMMQPMSAEDWVKKHAKPDS